MNYYINKTIIGDFDKTVEKIVSELKKEGFGVLTEIDIKATLKTKLNVDFYNYRILGACNPLFAYKALQAENKIGVMLPCNVIIQEKKPKEIEISAVDPVASMQAVANSQLDEIAMQIRDKLTKVVSNI